MNKKGCIRKTLLILLVTWAFTHFLLSDGLLVQDERARSLVTLVIIAMTVWGVTKLVAQRIGK